MGTHYGKPLRVVSLRNGEQLPNMLPSGKALELFSFESPTAVQLEPVGLGSAHYYGPFTLEIESHQHETTEVGAASQYGGTRLYTMTSQAGRVVVRPSESKS